MCVVEVGFDMRIFNIPAWYNFNIFMIGDEHIGSMARDEKLWHKKIEMITNEYEGIPSERNLVVDSGDHIEAMTPSDPRWDEYSSKNHYITEQQYIARRDYGEIKNHLIGICEGNHPWKYRMFGYLTKDLCEKELGVNYLGWSALIQYQVDGKDLFSHCVTHGHKAIYTTITDNRRDEVLKTNLRKKFARKQHKGCLIYQRGHSHLVIVAEPTLKRVRNRRNGKILYEYEIDDPAWYVCTGSGFRTENIGFDTYAEMFEYDPIRPGFTVGLVRDGKPAEIRKIYGE